MPTLEVLRRKVETVEKLESVVRTMKTLAAVNIRQYDRAATALADYNRTVEHALEILLKTQTERPPVGKRAAIRRLGAIVYGSDQGMCGQFNIRIAGHAADWMKREEQKAKDETRDTRGRSRRTSHADLRPLILVVGQRGRAALERFGQPVEESVSVPGSVAGITPLVQRLLAVIEQWRSRREIEHLVLFYHQYARSSSAPDTLRLLPLDPLWLRGLRSRKWPTRALPTFAMDPQRLFSSLIRQYLFVSLYRACAESLAAENASRLRSMQAAEKNIHDRLEQLNSLYHRQRQSAITAELLDVVAGSEALAD